MLSVSKLMLFFQKNVLPKKYTHAPHVWSRPWVGTKLIYTKLTEQLFLM